MAKQRWKRTTVTDNWGNSLSVWTWREYELAREVNLGLEGGWVFELTERRSRIGLYPDLVSGMRAAASREAVPVEPAAIGARAGSEESMDEEAGPQELEVA